MKLVVNHSYLMPKEKVKEISKESIDTVLKLFRKDKSDIDWSGYKVEVSSILGSGSWEARDKKGGGTEVEVVIKSLYIPCKKSLEEMIKGELKKVGR